MSAAPSPPRTADTPGRGRGQGTNEIEPVPAEAAPLAVPAEAPAPAEPQDQQQDEPEDAEARGGGGAADGGDVEMVSPRDANKDHADEESNPPGQDDEVGSQDGDIAMQMGEYGAALRRSC